MVTTKIQNTVKKIEEFIKKERLIFFFSQLLNLFAVVFFLLVTVTIWEILFKGNSEARTILTIIFMIVTIGISIYLLFKPIKLFVSKIEIRELIAKANKLGKENPNIKDELANVIDILNSTQKQTSEQLAIAAFDRIVNKFSWGEFKQNTQFLIKSLKYLFVSIVLFFVLLLSIPDFGISLNRIINYDLEFAETPKIQFEVSPKNIEVVKGDSLLISVKVIGITDEDVFFHKKDVDKFAFESRKVFQNTENFAEVKIDEVTKEFNYFFKMNGFTSDTFFVKVIDPPFVKSFKTTVLPPSYTKQKSVTYFNEGNLSVLRGSKVNFEITSSKLLDSAFIKINSGKTEILKIKKNNASKKISILKELNYKIILFDTAGNKNKFPIEYSISLLQDENPEIELLSPIHDIELATENEITVYADIIDDYGFSKMKLNYQLVQSRFSESWENAKQIEIAIEKNKLEQSISYSWDISNLQIEIDDIYSFYLEIFDNDNVSGPKSAKTKTIKIHLPPLEEMLAKTEKNQQEAFNDLEETLKEAIDLKKEMEKLSFDLKKNKEKLEWEEKSELEKAAKKFEELSKQAEEIKQNINKEKENLEKNNALSEKTLDKYNELQDLMKELDNEQLQKALENMNKNLEDLMRDEAQSSLEELKKNEEAFQKSLERTIELFKRILAEQKMDEVVKRIDDIQKMQEEIQKSQNGENSENQNSSSQMKKQNEISKKIKELEKEVQKLSELGKEIDDFPSEEMQKLSEEMKNQKNSELSEKAIEQMMMENLEMASEQQNQIMQNMQNASNQMMQMQNMMAQQNQMDVLSKMMNLTQQILEMSYSQEYLNQKTKTESLNRENTTQLSNQQNQLMKNLDLILEGMNSLSNKTFAITPEMGNAIGSAKSEMYQSISSMQNRDGLQTQNHQNSAMASLNDAANQMQTMMNNLANQQGQGGGMMSLSQQLRQMAGQQMQLNQATKQLQQMGEGQQRMAQMQKLASQQSAMQKSLEELNQEAKASGKSKKLATNLEKILDEMKEVVQNFESRKVDDDLVKAQENILSRLLDSQRSINERDFEKKRESFAGDDVVRKSPQEIEKLLREKENKLDRELLKALKSGYKKDYEEIIKNYYKKLKQTQK